MTTPYLGVVLPSAERVRWFAEEVRPLLSELEQGDR
jgi:hypothetical protein